MSLYQRIRLVVLFMLCAYQALANADDRLQISYPELPKEDATFQPSLDYLEKLLVLALDNSGYPYELRPVSVGVISEKRSHNYLTVERYKVHWMMTSAFHEESLIPIKIPLYKGLIGWRIFLIRTSDINRFSNLSDIDALRKENAGQAHDWPDTTILKNNGFSVVPMYSSEGRFNFLYRERCDYIPRSVLEIWKDLASAKGEHISVETTLALHYPAAYYFFVAPGETEIATAIEQGLHNAIQKGEFEKLFRQYFLTDIQRANLKNRRIFDVENPLFSGSDVLQNKRLWFNPEAY